MKRVSVIYAIVGLLALFCASPRLFAQTNGFSISPPPDWVHSVAWNLPTKESKAEKSESVRYFLYERQYHPQPRQIFTRVIVRAENESGVQDIGSLNFGFKPEYQDLIFHYVRIHRGNQILDRLEPAKIKVIQPESELDDHMFTGEKRAVLFLEDLRAGDTLEYAYTLRGANPVLGDHFSGRFVSQSSRPIDHRRVRVVWPFAKPLYVRQFQTNTFQTRVLGQGATELTLDFTNLTSIEYEDHVPNSYDPYPYVDFSDFENWARVVQWALPLYQSQLTNLSPELRELIAKWRQSTPVKEEQAREALQFVQDDLRYTGLELGPDSFQPAPPAETFQKRFGDCKGKALLFCAIMHELGIEAWPVLVDADGAANPLPSPLAFNHVIARLKFDSGVAWVDPTLSHQGGKVTNRYVPGYYGKALVIKPGVTGLEEISRPRSSLPDQQVTSTFKLKDYKSPVTFTVKTIYRRAEADYNRERAGREDSRDLTKEYLNYYARTYPGIETTKPLELHDDRNENVVTVTEHYQIRDLWKRNSSSKMLEAVFYAESLEAVLTEPRTRLRKMPLALSFPVRREHETVIHLPDSDWNLPHVQKAVDHEAFQFRYDRKFSNSTVRFRYECETKTNTVPAEKVPGYLSKLKEMTDELGDSLQRPDDRKGRALGDVNWLMIIVAGFTMTAVLLGAGWIWRVARLPANTPPPVPVYPQLQGLGGWLILVGFGLCIAPFIRIVYAAQNWDGFFSSSVWQTVAVPGGESYHALFGPVLIFEVMGNCFLLGLNLLVLCLFFAKRRIFPKAYITLLVGNAVFLLADELLGNLIPAARSHSDPQSVRQVIQASCAAVLWTSYTLKSRRVKATFVR